MTSYLRAFWQFNPSAIRRALALNLAAALTEGMSLLLLLPLLSLTGVLGQQAPSQGGAPLVKYLSGVNWSIETALAVFVAVISVQSLLALQRDRVSQNLYLRFADHLRKTLYAAIANARWSFLTGLHSGELTNVLTGEIQRINAGTYYLLRLLVVAFLACAYLAVALWLSVWVTVLALFTGAALWALLHGADKMAKQSGVLLSAANRNLSSQIQEFLSALKLVKIHGEESGNLHRFNHDVEAVTGRLIEFQHARTRVQAAYRAGGAMAMAFICYAALTWFKLPAAHLLVMVAIFARMLPQIAELQSGRQQLLHMLPAFAAWQSLLNACQENRDPLTACDAPAPLERHIVFEQVSFRHPLSRLTLEASHLEIPARKTTALLGASGAGKTTLLDLLSGLVMPNSGVIRVDGVPLPQLPGWRKNIAYIPQETLIQDGTIHDNLRWGNASPSEAEITHALEQSALAEWVRQLPQGLETRVGERGIKLSGGEKQRLALARALLRKPQLLILDEATSALDADNHRLVINTIRNLHGSMTILLVSHRHEELAGLIDGVVSVDEGRASPWRPVP